MPLHKFTNKYRSYHKYYKNILKLDTDFSLIFNGEIVQKDVHQTTIALEVLNRINGYEYFDISCENICNLSCPSCRLDIKSKHKKSTPLLYENINKLCLNAKIISGATGDFFANQDMLNILQNLPSDNNIYGVEFHTNGTLITETVWNRLKVIHDKYIKFFVSVDGWTKDIYEANRFPAKFETIVKRLDFINEVCSKNNYYLNIIMVVQDNNFEQIPIFLEKCKQMGAEYTVKLISNWYTFSDVEYKKRAVHYQDHPRFNQFLEILLNNNVDPRYIQSCSWDINDSKFLNTYNAIFKEK